MIERLILMLEVNHKQAMASFKNVESRLKFLEQQTNSLSKGMMSFGLSALFTGMAIKRLGQTMLTSLVKTYMSATNEQQILNQEVLAVQASFEFLKFSIMDALSNSDLVLTLIDGLINMVNWISEFVNQHPLIAKMIVAFLVFAIVIGTIGMIIGQVTLALLGMIGLSYILAPVLKAVAAIGLTPILFTILIIIAVIAVLWAMWQTNFGNIREFTKETFGILLDAFKGLFVNVFGILKGVWKILVGFLSGDFTMIMEGVKQIVANVVAGIVNLFIRLGSAIYNVFVFVVNTVTSLILGLIQSMIGAINKLLSWISTVSKGKITFGKIETPDFVKNALKPISYITQEAVKKATGGVDELMGLTAGTGNLASATKIPESTLDKNYESIMSSFEGSMTNSLDKVMSKYLPATGLKQTPLEGNLGDIKKQAEQLASPTTNNINVNIDKMMGDDDTMKQLFGNYIKELLDEQNNRFAGTTRGA